MTKKRGRSPVPVREGQVWRVRRKSPRVPTYIRIETRSGSKADVSQRFGDVGRFSVVTESIPVAKLRQDYTLWKEASRSG